jgi:hypothetical protein
MGCEEKAQELIRSAVLLDPASVQIRYLYYCLFDKKWPFINLNGLTESEAIK